MSLNRRKIGIIGAGHVGSHAGYALISQSLVEEIVYIDVDQRKAEAQALDLYDSSTYLTKHVNVYAGNYGDIKDADILIIAAGPLPDMAAGQTDRQQTLGATVAILKDIIPQIKASGFNGIIVNISNPADVVTLPAGKTWLGSSAHFFNFNDSGQRKTPPCYQRSNRI